MVYTLDLKLVSETGKGRKIQIPDEMAMAGATLYQQVKYTAGHEVRVAEKPFSRELQRADKSFVAALDNEMKGDNYLFILVGAKGEKKSVHGDYITFQNSGVSQPDNSIKLEAICVKAQTWGYAQTTSNIPYNRIS